MRRAVWLIALAVVVAGGLLAAQTQPLQAEKTFKYTTSEAIPLGVQVGMVKITSLKITEGSAGGLRKAIRQSAARMDPVVDTPITFSFDAQSPKGFGEWNVTYAIDLLDAKGQVIDRTSKDDSYEAEAKTSNFEHVTLKAVLPLIDSVRIKFQAAAD